jgi:hypothetical protein
MYKAYATEVPSWLIKIRRGEQYWIVIIHGQIIMLNEW